MYVHSLFKLTNDTRIGKWAFPGGHLEYGESFIDCAERETLEETALKVKGVKIAHVTNDIFEEAGKHYITLFVVCEMLDSQQQPQVRYYFQFCFPKIQVNFRNRQNKKERMGSTLFQGSVI